MRWALVVIGFTHYQILFSLVLLPIDAVAFSVTATKYSQNLKSSVERSSNFANSGSGICNVNCSNWKLNSYIKSKIKGSFLSQYDLELIYQFLKVILFIWNLYKFKLAIKVFCFLHRNTHTYLQIKHFKTHAFMTITRKSVTFNTGTNKTEFKLFHCAENNQHLGLSLRSK